MEIDKLEDVDVIIVLEVLKGLEDYLTEKLLHKVKCEFGVVDAGVVELRMNADMGKDMSPRFMHATQHFLASELKQNEGIIVRKVDEIIPQFRQHILAEKAKTKKRRKG